MPWSTWLDRVIDTHCTGVELSTPGVRAERSAARVSPPGSSLSTVSKSRRATGESHSHYELSKCCYIHCALPTEQNALRCTTHEQPQRRYIHTNYATAAAHTTSSLDARGGASALNWSQGESCGAPKVPADGHDPRGARPGLRPGRDALHRDHAEGLIGCWSVS